MLSLTRGWFPVAAIALLAWWVVGGSVAAGDPPALRVCADPNHLPYSNEAGEGFENQIAALLAEELGWNLEYTWWPQRRGFLRNTLKAGRCDVVMGIPAAIDAVATTTPYYRSCYVWVSRAEAPAMPQNFSDPALRSLRIGVHLIGDDYTNSPPAHALARRGVVDRVSGYSVYGDYGEPSPLRAPVDAVANGELDAAILWGPIAGFFARERALQIAPATLFADEPFPFQYAIAVGVRPEDQALRARLDRSLRARERGVAAILDRYGVPDCETSAAPFRFAAAEGGPAKNPLTGDTDAIAAGAKLYKKLNCYACHGAAGGGGMGPNLTDDRWQNGDGSDAALMVQIMEGRAAMPPYGELIDESEAWQLIAFIRTLYKGDPSKATW